jgi:DnaJ-class molecular chaperone
MSTYVVRIVRCPDCKGTKRVKLIVHDELLGKTVLTTPLCQTCEGTGKVKGDVVVQ